MKTLLKNRLRTFSNPFAIIPSRPVRLKRREFILELKRGGRSDSDLTPCRSRPQKQLEFGYFTS